MTALIMDNGVKFTEITDYKLVDKFLLELLCQAEGEWVSKEPSSLTFLK